MIPLQPNSLTLKPKPRAYTAKDFPLKRSFNDYGYFELSGSAVTTKAERDLLDKQYRWDTFAVLSLFGLSDYVARNRSQPKHTLITHDLYNTSFEFELKRVNGISPPVVSVAPLKFMTDAAGVLTAQYDPAVISAMTAMGDQLSVMYDNTKGVIRADAAGNVFWSPLAGSVTVMACPLVDGFADNRVEFRTAQQFSSGRIRQVGKRAGFLREVSFRQDLTADGAAEFVRFYRDYDHEPLTLAWVTAQFGAGRRFVFGQSPWEIKATGSTFDLSVQGFIV